MKIARRRQVSAGMILAKLKLHGGIVLGQSLLGHLRKFAFLPFICFSLTSGAQATGPGGTPPVGHYSCSSSPIVVTAPGAYGTNITRLGQWQGDIWILDAHRYAGPYHSNDIGSYRMNGNTMVALNGSYAPPRNRTQLTYVAPAGGHPAVIQIVFVEADNKPSTGTTCYWKDGATK